MICWRRETKIYNNIILKNDILTAYLHNAYNQWSLLAWLSNKNIVILPYICELCVQFSFEQLCQTFQINSLNPKCDQYQTSPSDINALQNRLVMRIKDMITQDTMRWYFNNFSLLGNVQGQQMGIWILISWLKGLKSNIARSAGVFWAGESCLVMFVLL